MILATVVVAVLGACSGKSPSISARASTPCTFTPSNDDTGGRHPGLPGQPGAGPTRVRFVTSGGSFTIQLDAEKAPCTVASFRHLVGSGFYNGTRCNHLTTTAIFILQCGDPTGTGSGGPGYTIPDENLAGASYPSGTVAMANDGKPHTGGSQFFIVYQSSPLPPQYTPFGRVISGLDVIRKVAAAGSDNANGSGDGSPLTPVEIFSATMF